MLFEMTIHTQPIPKGRPRLTRYGAKTPKRTRVFEALVRAHARRAWGRALLAGACGIRVDAFWARPKRPTKGHPCRDGPAEAFPLALGGRYGDADNVLKAVCDSLNGAVWVDDAQVHHCECRRWWAAEGDGPSVVVRVWVVDG